MAKINKIINVKVEGVGKIKQLEESLKKLRKQQRDIKKDMKDGANAGKHAEQQYKKNANAIKQQSGALRETKKAMVDANNTTKKSNNLQKSMTMGVIKGAAAFSILVTAFRRVSQALVTMIGTFIEFEFTMAKVKAVTGANDAEFKRLGDSALELGRSTFFTASEVANLQLNLSKLGFTTQEVLDATQATINLAVATGSDLARAATVAGNAIRGFQLDASEAGRVVDIMAVAFTSSALDIEKWQTSMTKVAPIAAMAGFSIEEVTAIMAKLSDTGIEASIAGTSLRNIFLKMQDRSSDLSQKIGHTVTNLDQMLAAFKKLKDEGTDLNDILGFMDVRQVAAFGTMLEGADDIAKLRDELEQAGGAGQLMADTVGDTLQGSIFKFKSALQGLSIFLVQKFGNAMKKTLTKMAEWFNKIVKNEKGINTLIKSIKWTVKALLGYVIASKGAVLWTRIMGAGLITMSGLANAATAAFVRLTTAIAKTGIGLLIMELIHVGYLIATYDEAASAAHDWGATTEDAMIKALDSTVEYDLALKKVKDSQEEQNKMKADGITLDNATELQAVKLKRAMYEEATAIRVLNKGYAAHGIEMVKIGEKYDVIAEKHTMLIKSLRKSASQQIFIEQQKGVMETAVGVETLIKRVEANWKKLGHSAYSGQAEDWIERHVKMMMLPSYQMGGGELAGFGEGVMSWVLDLVGDGKSAITIEKEMSEAFERLFDESGITLGTVLEVIQKGAEDYVSEHNEIVLSTLEDLYDFDLDLLIPEEPTTTEIEPTDALYEMNKLVSAAKKKIHLQDIENTKDRAIALLKAEANAILEYIGQNPPDDLKAAAELKYMEVYQRLKDAKFAMLVVDFEVERALRKDNAEQEVLDGTAQAEYLFSVLNNIDEEQNNKILEATELAGKDQDKIKEKIRKQTIKSTKDNFDRAEKLATQKYDKDKIDLELSLANEEITKMEHDARMLSLEAEHLANMAALYALYGQTHIDIDNDITRNTIATKELQREALREYISALGELGGFMQDVAGEEEKMNGIRKAGIIITEAAATAEKIMALMSTLSTLANYKNVASEAAKVAMTGAVVASDTAKTGSSLALAGANFLHAIANGIKALPVWAQIVGILAMVGIISAAKRNISSSFNTPVGDDSGGGGRSSSGGGGRSSSGAMSYYTYGGQHSTYADGGMVYGNSHAKGGEKFSVGGRVVELEGGEAVINKRSTSMFRSQLSAMNSVGGGVKFADGGVTNNPSFAQTQFDVTNQSSNRGSSKVVVVEADITSTQNTVKTIEAEASF